MKGRVKKRKTNPREDYHGEDYHGEDYHGEDYHGKDYHGEDHPGEDYTLLFHAFPSLVRTLIGRYLSQDFRDYFALARVTKRLWIDYCSYDPSVVFMRFVQPFKYSQSMILNSGLPICIQWQWNRDCKDNARRAIARRYAEAGAAFGLLNIIQMVAPFIDGVEQYDAFTNLVDIMAREKHDKALLCFVQNPPWPIDLKHPEYYRSKRARIALYFSAVKYVTHLPLFFNYADNQLLLPNDIFENNEEARVVTILAVACTGDVRDFRETFDYFWRKMPEDFDTRKRCAGLVLYNLFCKYGEAASKLLPLLIEFFFKEFISSEPQENMWIFNFEQFQFVYQKEVLNDEVLCKMSALHEDTQTAATFVVPIKWLV